MDKNSTLKRKREKTGNKRWADTEIMQLLKYLQEQPEFERPTAQIFYRKFLKTSNVNATWDLLRWKVKYLKTTYFKAETWRRSNEAKLLEAEEGVLAVQDKLKRLCRFYDDLHCIFAQKFAESSCDVADGGTTSNMSFNSMSATENTDGDFESMDDSFVNQAAVIKEEYEYIDVPTPSPNYLTSPATSPASSLLPHEPPEVEKEPNHGNNSEQEFITTDHTNILNRLSRLQNENKSFLHMKLEFEKEKFKKEFKLEERKLAEKIQERKENFELKKLEMEKDERLRILELEKQERIERFEIEMRYKHVPSHSPR